MEGVTPGLIPHREGWRRGGHLSQRQPQSFLCRGHPFCLGFASVAPVGGGQFVHNDVAGVGDGAKHLHEQRMNMRDVAHGELRFPGLRILQPEQFLAEVE